MDFSETPIAQIGSFPWKISTRDWLAGAYGTLHNVVEVSFGGRKLRRPIDGRFDTLHRYHVEE